MGRALVLRKGSVREPSLLRRLAHAVHRQAKVAPLIVLALVTEGPSVRPASRDSIDISGSWHPDGEAWQSIEASDVLCLAVLSEPFLPFRFRPANERIAIATI